MKGSCLCGAVKYEALGDAEGFAACHCGQCRRQAGHVWASAHVPDDKLRITGEVRWFQSSEKARRGFCPVCGSSLFWKHRDDDHTSFSLGSVDGPTGGRLQRQPRRRPSQTAMQAKAIVF